MTTTELLDALHGLGVFVAAKDGRLVIDAPRGVITPAIRAELFTHKAELLAVLDTATQAPTAAPEKTPGPGLFDKFPTGANTAPPWVGLWVRLEDLPTFAAKWGLVAVGGDPDLLGQPWQPKVIYAAAP